MLVGGVSRVSTVAEVGVDEGSLPGNQWIRATDINVMYVVVAMQIST